MRFNKKLILLVIVLLVLILVTSVNSERRIPQNLLGNDYIQDPILFCTDTSCVSELHNNAEDFPGIYIYPDRKYAFLEFKDAEPEVFYHDIYYTWAGYEYYTNLYESPLTFDQASERYLNDYFSLYNSNMDSNYFEDYDIIYSFYGQIGDFYLYQDKNLDSYIQNTNGPWLAWDDVDEANHQFFSLIPNIHFTSEYAGDLEVFEETKDTILPSNFMCKDYYVFSHPTYSMSSYNFNNCLESLYSMDEEDVINGKFSDEGDYVCSGDSDSGITLNLGFNKDLEIDSEMYHSIESIELYTGIDGDQGGDIAGIKFLILCEDKIYSEDNEDVCVKIYGNNAWHPNAGNVDNDCCEPADENIFRGNYKCYTEDDEHYMWIDSSYGDEFFCGEEGQSCDWETSANINSEANNGSDGCCGDDIPILVNNTFDEPIISDFVIDSNEFMISFEILTEEDDGGSYFYCPTILGFCTPGSNSNDFGIITKNGNLGMWSGLNSNSDIDNDFISTTLVNDGNWHNITVINDGETIKLYSDYLLLGTLDSGDSLDDELIGILKSNSSCSFSSATSHSGELRNLVILPYFDENINLNSFNNYNDLYYVNPLNQFVCSIKGGYSDYEGPESMDLTFENEDFFGLDWKWLDAWEESYVIHNLQLPETNHQIVSNADDWFVCNGLNSDSVLGWDTNDPDISDDDKIIENFEVLPAEGSKEGQCPAGYWFCSCIPEVVNDFEDDIHDECLNINLGANHYDTTVNSYFHATNKRCVASPYLCNADFDIELYENDEGSTCTEGGGLVCSDGDEIYAEPNPTLHNDNTSCPSQCNGWLGLTEIEYSFEPTSSNWPDELIKENCTNGNIGDCFETGPVLIEICNDYLDNDYDGYVDCEDADCYMSEFCPDYQELGIEGNCIDGRDNDSDCCDSNIWSNAFINDSGYCEEGGYDTNLDGIFCGLGDFNVDCEDADCASHSSCAQPPYPGLAEFAAPKNESIICHERSGNSLFTECCDNFGLSCNNGDANLEFFRGNSYTPVRVDRTTNFVGRGVPLYFINSFDKYLTDRRYVDYVRITQDISINLKFNTSNAERNLDLSSLDYDYYKSIEFDLAYSNLSNIEIKYFYTNLFGEEDHILIDKTNMHLYSNNGVQNYRWHHVLIPITSNMKQYLKVDFDVLNGLYDKIAIDNVFFGVNKSQDYYNYKCAGAFGFWIDEFDPNEAEGLSCNNVYGDACDACDRMQGVEDCEITPEMIENKDNPNWYDFDPFKYVCDSYLSYGWSGTACCGDDTDRLNKEFYLDYQGGCWNGYLIRNNQRVGDAMYFNDDTNSMNKFMFYDNYYICDPNITLSPNDVIYDGGIGIFNQSLLEEDYSFYGLDELNGYQIYGEDIEFNITSKDVCEIVHQDSKYYCQGTGLWMSSVPGIDDWNSSIPLYLKPNSTGQLGGCCPIEACWTGEECVLATDYEYNSNKEAFNKSFDGPDHILFAEVNNSSGMRCVFNDLGNAIWEEAQPKYDWELNNVGFCKHSDYCFVDEGFNFNYNTRTEGYQEGIIVHGDGCCDVMENGEPYPGEIVDGINADCLSTNSGPINVSDSNCDMHNCIPSGVSVDVNNIDPDLFAINNYGKYYCDSGNWTTKLSKLSDKMYNWFGSTDDDFSIACDDELILNTDNESDLFNDNSKLLGACVYSKDNGGVAIGFALGEELQEDGIFLEELLSVYTGYGVGAFIDCDTTTENVEQCGKLNSMVENFYYDNELNTLIVTDVTPDLTPSSASEVIDEIVEFFYGIFYPGFESDFFVLKGNTAYDKLYMSHKGNFQVKAAQEEKYDESLTGNPIVERMSINYSKEFNFENILNDTFQIALFEDGVIEARSLSDDFMFNRCKEDGFLIVRRPKVNLMNLDDSDNPNNFAKDDLLWTYLTKTLRLTGEGMLGENDVITGELCTNCDHTDSLCNDEMICSMSLNKCVGALDYEGCNFHDECSIGLECIENVCSNPEGEEDEEPTIGIGETELYIGCNNNTLCEGFGLTCVDNSCVNYGELDESCDDNFDCIDDLVCIGDVCNITSNLGSDCDVADDSNEFGSDCSAGFVCDENICKALPGSICDVNENCASVDEIDYTCIGSMCTYLGGADWYAGEVEDCDSSLIMPTLAGDLCDYTECNDANPCNDPYVCVDDVCKLPTQCIPFEGFDSPDCSRVTNENSCDNGCDIVFDCYRDANCGDGESACETCCSPCEWIPGAGESGNDGTCYLGSNNCAGPIPMAYDCDIFDGVGCEGVECTACCGCDFDTCEGVSLGDCSTYSTSDSCTINGCRWS